MSTSLAPLPKLPPSPPPPGLGEGEAAPPGGRGAPLPTLSAGHGGTLGTGRRSLPPGGRRAPLSPPRTATGQRLPVNPGAPGVAPAPQAAPKPQPKQAPTLSPDALAQIKALLPSQANTAQHTGGFTPKVNLTPKHKGPVGAPRTPEQRERMHQAAVAAHKVLHPDTLPNGQPFDAAAADAEPHLAPGHDVKDIFTKLDRTDLP